MSSVEVEMCTAILEDHFGQYVASVGHLLLVQQLGLPLIYKGVVPKMRLKELKRSLVVLEHHNLLEMSQPVTGQGRILYSVPMDAVLRLVRVPRSVYLTRTLYGKVGEAIFEEIASRGRVSCSDCIRSVCRLLDDVSEGEVAELFAALCDARLIIQCPSVKGDDGGEDGEGARTSIFVTHIEDPFAMPKKLLDAGHGRAQRTSEKPNGKSVVVPPSNSRKRKAAGDERGEKEMAVALAKDSDWRVLWRINWERVDLYLRNELVVDLLALNEAFSKSTLTVARILLNVSVVKSSTSVIQSGYVSLHDVVEYATRNALNMDGDYLDEKLVLLSRESDGVINRTGESSGGVYTIDFEQAIAHLSFEQAESVIREKLDGNAARIFCLLRTVGSLEEEQIERRAMIPSTETRKACNALLDGGFISIKHISRFGEFAPSRTFYLCSLLASKLITTMSQLTSLTLRNLMRRRIHEATTHKPLTNRQFNMESIMAKIRLDPGLDGEAKQEQLADVEKEYMSASDKLQLARFRQRQQRFWANEIEVEKSLFLIYQHRLFVYQAQLRATEGRVSSRRRQKGQAATAVQTK